MEKDVQDREKNKNGSDYGKKDDQHLGQTPEASDNIPFRLG